MSDPFNPPDRGNPGASKAVVESQLMQNPWNAMYNDRPDGAGIGASVGNRAGAGGVADWNDPLNANRMRWDGKYIIAPPGSNPFAWVESYSQSELDRHAEMLKMEAEHHDMMRKGKLQGSSAIVFDKTTQLTPTTEQKRMARCAELEKKLGVDKVVLDPMKLQIDTTAWGVSAAQDKKRATASYDGGLLPRARDKTNVA